MKTRRTRAVRFLSLVLAAALPGAQLTVAQAEDAAATTAPAPPTATTPAPAPAPSADPQEHMQELDEITVHGKRLAQAIADAEDDFYQLYNKVDKDDKYHTSCVYLNIDPDHPSSGIKTRVCLPGFVADAMADWAVWKARCQPPEPGTGYDEFDCLDRNKDGRLSWNEAQAREELGADFPQLDSNHDGMLSRQEFAAQTSAGPPAIYQPPPPQLVLMEGSKGWYDHMMKVVNGDPRLQEKAGHLDDLYHELASVQREFGKAQAATAKDQPPKVVRTNNGPRAN